MEKYFDLVITPNIACVLVEALTDFLSTISDTEEKECISFLAVQIIRRMATDEADVANLLNMRKNVPIYLVYASEPWTTYDLLRFTGRLRMVYRPNRSSDRIVTMEGISLTVQ